MSQLAASSPSRAGPSSSSTSSPTRTSPPHSPSRARARLPSVPEDSLAFALALGRHTASTSARSHSFSSPSSSPSSPSGSRPIMTTAQTTGRISSGSPLRPSGVDKGKGRDMSAYEAEPGRTGGNALASSSSMSTLRGSPMSSRAQRPVSQRPQQRADWVVDLDQVAAGSKRWKEVRASGSSSGRVVLVMGEPSPATIERLLVEPLFSSGLIIIASEQPGSSASPPTRPRKFSMPRPSSSSTLSSEFKASPSLKSVSRPGSTYGLPALSEDGNHQRTGGPCVEYITSKSGRPLKEILEEAAGIARKWRSSNRSANNPPSRVNSPPTSRRGSTTEVTSARPRPASIASFRSLTRSTTSDSLQGGQAAEAGSPFDVLLHFVPTGQAFQTLLQQAVMLTTAALPFMDRQIRVSVASGVQGEAQPPASGTTKSTLLHILPTQCPQPLPRVLDSFLASLIPSSHASMQGFVLADSLLEAPLRVGRNGHTGFSALDVVLSGGLTSASGGAQRARSYLGSFSECRFLGLSLEPPAPITGSQAISRASSSTSLDESTPEATTRRPSANERGYESSQLATAVWTATQAGQEDGDGGQLSPPRLSWSEGGESTTSSASLPTTPDLEKQEIPDVASEESNAQPNVEVPSKPAKKGWFGRAFGRKSGQA